MNSKSKGYVWRTKIKGGRKCRIFIGKHAHINNSCLNLSDDTNIEVGEYSRLNNVKFIISGNFANIKIGGCCSISNTTFWIEDVGNSIDIGYKTFMGEAHIAVTGYNKKVSIGNNCMFSSGVVIRTGDSHAIIDINSGNKINIEKDVCISNHVWIAQDVKVLKGTEIGENCIVGCNSVLSGIYSPNALIVGTPAKILRTNVSWSSERML